MNIIINNLKVTRNIIIQTWKTIYGIIGRCKSGSQQNIKTEDGDIVTELNRIFLMTSLLASGAGIKHSGKDYSEYLLNSI